MYVMRNICMKTLGNQSLFVHLYSNVTFPMTVVYQFLLMVSIALYVQTVIFYSTLGEILYF